jgi:hypothetical protein
MKSTINLGKAEALFIQKLYYIFSLLTVAAIAVIPCAGLHAYWLYGRWPDGSYSNLQYLSISWYQLVHTGLVILVVLAHFTNLSYLFIKLLMRRTISLTNSLFLLLGLAHFLASPLLENISFCYSYWFFDD